ncbi:MAG: hypothetical protein K2X74_20260, partial [Acetobacteraceae bacterium]|nr:hypothetical protein [Acetobacteraceae bacterium]
TFRRTAEDEANLAAIVPALRAASGRPFTTASDTIRAALRVAAMLARRGELGAALNAYRADLAA